MNTPYAVAESSKLVKQLITRTKEGKIQWREPLVRMDADERFDTSLDGDLKVFISSSKQEIEFTVCKQTGLDDRKLISVALEHNPSFGYDIAGEQELHHDLVELHEYARRTALNVDGSLESARAFLENL